MLKRLVPAVIGSFLFVVPLLAAEGRKSVVLEHSAARMVIDLAGGSIGEFRQSSIDVNPLSWNAPKPGETGPQAFGHFLCLDRWGPPSDAEGKRGMPYHGEASHVIWNLDQEPRKTNGMIEAVVSAKLPKAGLGVRRVVRFSSQNNVFAVQEEITNEKDLGRIFNVVQHPSIAPPFLDEKTIVDCNGRRGFAQGGSLPNPEEPSSDWPKALKKNGSVVDIRHLTNDPDPNVVSYAIEEQYGWVTAANPAKGLLIGYVWRASDYPWVSLWRDVRDGKPAARGLEFGSTGLHQPFPILAEKGRIWDRPLFEYIDAGQTITKRYSAFLVPIPSDFTGVSSAEVKGEFITLREHKGGVTHRDYIVSLRGATLE